MAFSDILKRARMGGMQQQTSPYGTVAGVQAATDAQIDRERGYGNVATDAYLDRARSFDASAALDRYAKGAYNTISQGLRQTLADESGRAVGAGRFDSGFYDEDRGVIINRATDQLNNAIAGQSMNAMAAQQRNDEGLGNFGMRYTEDANDLLTARSEQVQNDARAEAERRRRKGGIAGAIGGALKGAVSGFASGGPWGAVAGGTAGAIGGYGYN